jgi:hypothetical protein
VGPLLTGMCLVFAIAIVWTLVWPFFKTAPINLKDFIELSISVGGFLVTARARSARSKAKTFRLTPSFNSGLYGGLIGGAVAGLFIGVAYYLQYRSLDESVTLAVIPEIFLFSSIGGLVLGAFITLLILWFRHIAPELFLNEAIGGVRSAGPPLVSLEDGSLVSSMNMPWNLFSSWPVRYWA